mgnify:CR=1 FL=1
MSQRKTSKVSDTQPERRVSSKQLLPQGTLYIRHNDEDYCLRVTKNGKLILTK